MHDDDVIEDLSHRAEHCWRLLEQLTDEPLRLRLLQLARDYERRLAEIGEHAAS